MLVPGGYLGIIWSYPDFQDCTWIKEIGHFLSPLYEKRDTKPLPMHVPYFLSKVLESEMFDQVCQKKVVVNVESNTSMAYNMFCSMTVMLVADENTKIKFKHFFDEVIERFFTSQGNTMNSFPFVVPVYVLKKKFM